ncbi:Tyrosine-protein phosphatase non-receptor type 13-like protein [Dinothrombium tinctorium]|uniref:Tyrosine-protein phosphatase non-receptor type 13-like protein n=1 Tax=Dinothrombium tinctorium TaxID=1965070 RepID=A0A3S3P728_9ACAR|nr:Tyrosine-protein phosphatase non-receptor type 13-like protein [Dinothrombium tinctorium]RWS16288.1 Tyrosine-protein phosphatase non-receptor type 13-like protein [Dinothrombium tinctorium]
MLTAFPYPFGITDTESPIRLDIPPTPPKRKKKLRASSSNEFKNEASPAAAAEEENCSQMVQQIEQHKLNANLETSKSCEKRFSAINGPYRRSSHLSRSAESNVEETIEFELSKFKGSLGIKILGGEASVDGSGIYVQSVSPGSSAEESNLQPGDEILEVNGTKLTGIDYPLAVKLLKDSPVNCHLTVKRIINQTDRKLINDRRMPSHNHVHQISDSSNSSLQSQCLDKYVNNEPSLFNNHIVAEPICDDLDSGTPSADELIPNLQLKTCEDIYLFLNDRNARKVRLQKNTRGIGMSFCGGIDMVTNNSVENLIRVKRIFPSEPADRSGQISVGDIIIEANGRCLVGCTKMEAVNILHSLSDNIELVILKPDLIPSLNSPKIVTPSPSSSFSSCPSPIFEDNYNLEEVEEYEVTLVKINGSLGFTIVKIENEGFFVKELTKEPAVSNRKISSGDKILLVNGIDVSSMSHSGAISFLRSLPDTVTLRLQHSTLKLSRDYLDSSDFKESVRKNKKQLRHEARMMLNDKTRLSQSPNRLKVRKDRRKSRECQMDATKLNDSEAKLEQNSNSKIVNCNVNHSRPKSFNLKSEKEYIMHSDSTLTENNNFLIRQLSVVETNRNHPIMKDACFLRWRGTTLSDEQNTNISKEITEDCLERSAARDEQDSGFGESTGLMKQETSIVASNDLSPPSGSSTTGFSFFVTLDRRWHGRLGFALIDDPDPSSEVNACVVRAIFPNSVAAKDGRIRVGDKLLEVNGESMVNRAAKEVIDNLRKMKGKMTFLFVRNVQQSDL